MKSRIVIGILLLLLLGSLLMPFFSIYPHMGLPPEIASEFPAQATGAELILKGNKLLPIDLMPSLASLPFRRVCLAFGMALALLGGLLAMVKRRGFAHVAALLGGIGMLHLLLFAFYAQQLDNSLLYNVMLTTKWYVWAVLVLSAGLFGMELWMLKGVKHLPLGTNGWRNVSALLCALALLALLLPFASTYVADGTFASPEEDRLATRSVAGWKWLGAGEPQLSQIASQNGAFADPVSAGALANLITLSGSERDVQNLFMIPKYNGGLRAMAVAACSLLLLGLVLQLIRKVDKWIPAGLIVTGSIVLLTEIASSLTVNTQYQFMGAVDQMMLLGMGGYTIVPLLMVGLAAGASLSAVLGIRRANEPYFINPISEKKRMFAVSLTFAVVSILLLLSPVYQVSLYAPGKIKTVNPPVKQAVSGLHLLSMARPDTLMNPVNARGRALYGTEAAVNGLTLGNLQALISNILNKLAVLAVIPIALALAAIFFMLYRRRDKKTIVVLLYSSAVMQAVMTLAPLGLIPEAIGRISAIGPLYASLGTTVFSAFFAGFMDKETLPKKYKLFLMMLPFLVAVFLFSYLPLYGWSYAFYNYKFGIPMNQQEFVGFKWFAELVMNPGHRNNIARVMSNTFAMSGLGILTSWMPMVFAILLNEVSRTKFKKFVQIFTTLPNFISWTLVFSFAMAMFAMDTGIYSKFMLGIGAIDVPVAWLNSAEHIWIKMWAWNLWKGLGWGAIMYLAAIAGIDQELYEAARVDGAGRWRQMRHITLPGLLPTFFVLLLLSISNIINNGMDQYLVFQNSMNKDTIEVLDLYVYNITIASTSSSMYSFGAAIGVLKTLFSVTLLFSANFVSKLLRGESIV